jgi:hypothetical protein
MPRKSRPDKLCSGCKRLLPIEAYYTYSPLKPHYNVRYSPRCRSCIKSERRQENARGAGIPKNLSPKHYLNHLRLKAKTRKGSINITTAELVDLWERQKGKCALTDWKMTMRRRTGIVRTNASIDRIDSSKGYTLDNIQLVCVAANKAKFDLSHEEFVKLCRSVLTNARKRSVPCPKKPKKTSRPSKL